MVTPDTPSVRRRRSTIVAGTDGISLALGPPENWSVTVLLASESAPDAPWSLSRVEMSPKETLVTKSARMRPLIARNAPRGLSDMRRPAIRVAGPVAQRDIAFDPAMVNHGPATTSPIITRMKPRKYALT